MSRGQRSRAEDPAYESLLSGEDDHENNEIHDERVTEEAEVQQPFSWVAYFIFMLLGVAMLWAWNMFLAAAPYFQRRFETDPWILNHFQPAEVSVANVTGLVSLMVLGSLQKNASYPRRVLISLVINIVAFTILALSTAVQTSPPAYFGFLLVLILITNFGSALLQNGLFSYAVGFGRSEYTQAIMTGHAIAGVLPPLTQIISVVAVKEGNQGGDTATQADSWKAAFAYFITATAVSAASLGAFVSLLHQRARYGKGDTSSGQADPTTSSSPEGTRKTVNYWRLFRKIPYLAIGVNLCFVITMLFPVFTIKIQSTRGISPALFIPLGFLMWNFGDLCGRLVTAWPKISLTHYPFALFCLSGARLLFIPLYLACNINGRGTTIGGDFFYLVVVQFLFGLTNGYVGSSCMMAAGSWVAVDEREAAGGFMIVCLVSGLTIGSLLSFTLGDI